MISPCPPSHKHQNKKGGKEGGRGNDRSDEGDAIRFRMAQQVFLLKELKETRVKRLKMRTDKDTALQLCELLTDAVWGGKRKHAIFPVLLYLVYSVRQVEEA